MIPRRIVVGTLGQAIGVSGSFLFAVLALHAPHAQIASEFVRGLVLATIISTALRLGTDSFIISKFRNKPPSRTATASLFAALLTLGMTALAAPFFLIADYVWPLHFDIALLFLSCCLALNSVVANYLIITGYRFLGLISRGNVPYFSASVLLFLPLPVGNMLELTGLLTLAPGVLVCSSPQFRRALPKLGVLAHSFPNWACAFIYESRHSMVYTLVSAVWVNWIYLLSSTGTLTIDDRFANLFQRIVNGFNSLAYMFFIVDPYFLPKSAINALLTCICTLQILSNAILGASTPNVLQALIIGSALGLYQFGRVSAMESRSYVLLSTQVVLLMTSTLLFSGGGPWLSSSICIGIIGSLILDRSKLSRWSRQEI